MIAPAAAGARYRVGSRAAAPAAAQVRHAEVALARTSGPARWVRRCTAGALLVTALYVLSAGSDVVAFSEGWGRPDVVAVLATVVLVPLHLRHVWFAAHGLRPPAGGWTLAAVTVVVFATLPLIDMNRWWLAQLHLAAVAAVVVLRRPWNVVGAAVVLAAGVALALVIGPGPETLAIVAWLLPWRFGATIAMIWLAVALRRLAAAQAEAENQAVVAERQRIDGELDTTLGTAIAAVAERATRLAEQHPPSADDIEALIERARSALADARRLARSYRRSSLDEELAATVRILTDAGITTRLRGPVGEHPRPVADGIRLTMRATVAELLAAADVRSCELAVVGRGAAARLVVRTERAAS